MEFEQPLENGVLLRRYKRFLTDVKLSDGSEITIHCPNTGSMKNCLYPNETVWFSRSNNPKRKYPCTFELMETPSSHIIGVNTHRANALAEEAINNGVIKELQSYTKLQREVKYGEENSRIDFLLTADDKADCYIEVKSCTLLEGDCGYFPDAVTQRGQKHLRELMQIVTQRKRAVLLFVVQHSGIDYISIAKHIDEEYAKLFKRAVNHGVEVLAYGCELSLLGIKINRVCQILV